jgi:hypothetical protein
MCSKVFVPSVHVNPLVCGKEILARNYFFREL